MTIASPPLVKQRRSRDPELTQNLILKAATDAFAMHGFEGATLPKIAASAGVSTPLLVHYFKSKRQLWETVFERLSADSRNELEALASESGSSAAERLRRIIAFQVRFFTEKPAIYQILANEAHFRSDRLTWICDHFARYAYKAVVQTICEAQAEGAVRPLSPERLRYMIIGVASISAISAEYEYLTGQDPRTPAEVEATIDFINQLIFVQS